MRLFTAVVSICVLLAILIVQLIWITNRPGKNSPTSLLTNVLPVPYRISSKPIVVMKESYYYKGRTYFIQRFDHCDRLIPRCILYSRRVSLQSKYSSNQVMVTPGGYFDPRSLRPVDFLKSDGKEIVGRHIGRAFIYRSKTDQWGISIDYQRYRNDQSIEQIFACGERLCPLRYDRHDTDFSSQKYQQKINIERQAFARAVTKRVAIGLDAEGNAYIIKAKCRLTELDEFMSKKLGCTQGLNLDGGSSLDQTPFIIVWERSSSP